MQRRCWQGWRTGGDGEAVSSASSLPWMDLSHPVHEGLPRMPSFPVPRVSRLLSMPGDPMNVTEVQMACHVGTHLDAPCHFIPDGPSIDQIPVERLHGPGVVWRLEAQP